MRLLDLGREVSFVHLGFFPTWLESARKWNKAKTKQRSGRKIAMASPPLLRQHHSKSGSHRWHLGSPPSNRGGCGGAWNHFFCPLGIVMIFLLLLLCTSTLFSPSLIPLNLPSPFPLTCVFAPLFPQVTFSVGCEAVITKASLYPKAQNRLDDQIPLGL